MQWLGLLVLGVCFVPVLIAFVAFKSVMQLSNPSLALQPADPDTFKTEFQEAMLHDKWATDEGFEWVGTYLLTAPAQVFIAAWRHVEYPAFFCVYVHAQGKHTDIVTIYENDLGITTGSSKDGLLFPSAPGSYMQCLPNISVHQQWQNHLEAEAFLLEKLKLDPRPIGKPFDVIVMESIRRQMAHVRRIPLWPLRTVWWFFVRRNKLAGMTIPQQYDKGLIAVD